MTDLGQFLSSEVKCDGLCVAGVVDFDVDLVVVLVFPDQRSLEAGHLVLLPMDKDLKVDEQVLCIYLLRGEGVNRNLTLLFTPPGSHRTTCGGLRALMNSLVCW